MDNNNEKPSDKNIQHNLSSRERDRESRAKLEGLVDEWVNTNQETLKNNQQDRFAAIGLSGVQHSGYSYLPVFDAAIQTMFNNLQQGQLEQNVFKIYFVTASRIYDVHQELEKYQAAHASAKTTRAIDEVFENLKTLPVPVSRLIVDDLEEFLVRDLMESPSAELENMKKAIGMVDELLKDKSLKGQFALKMIENRLNDENDSLKLLSQSYLRISEAKGDMAHPIVKAYAEEASKLSDEEYANSMNHAKVGLTIYDRFHPTKTKQPNKGNPFIKGPP